jgi:cytochrome c nitrite reductase small subunit
LTVKISRRTKIVLIVVIAIGVIGVGGGLGALQASKLPSFCAICHVVKPYYESWTASDYLDYNHAQAGVLCKDCHDASIEESVQELVVYVKGDYEDPLKERKFSKEWCFRCHEHESFEEIIKLTCYLEEKAGANPHDSHYGEMECRLCHKIHRASEDYCAQCHFFEWEEEP